MNSYLTSKTSIDAMLALAQKWEVAIQVAYSEYAHGQRAAACCPWRQFADNLRHSWDLPDKIIWQRAYVAWRKYAATPGEYLRACRRERHQRAAFTPAGKLVYTCLAKGCSRRIKGERGFCWQHSDMVSK